MNERGTFLLKKEFASWAFLREAFNVLSSKYKNFAGHYVADFILYRNFALSSLTLLFTKND